MLCPLSHRKLYRDKEVLRGFRDGTTKKIPVLEFSIIFIKVSSVARFDRPHVCCEAGCGRNDPFETNNLVRGLLILFECRLHKQYPKTDYIIRGFFGQLNFRPVKWRQHSLTFTHLKDRYGSRKSLIEYIYIYISPTPAFHAAYHIYIPTLKSSDAPAIDYGRSSILLAKMLLKK